MKRAISILLSAGSLLLATNVLAVEGQNADFSADQKGKIEKIVRDYLIANPEVLVDASRSLQKKQQDEMAAQAQAAIAQNKQKLFDSQSPIAGDDKGDVTIVEFFDYQCGHCKKMFEVVDQLLKKDAKVKFVFKELPIFGGASEFASKAALAAQKQGKYLAFHDALMASKETLSNEKILVIAKGVGLNTKKLQHDMKQPDIKQQIEANMQLAQDLHLMGTPAFVVGGSSASEQKTFFVPGATTLDSLQQLVSQTRNAAQANRSEQTKKVETKQVTEAKDA